MVRDLLKVYLASICILLFIATIASVDIRPAAAYGWIPIVGIIVSGLFTAKSQRPIYAWIWRIIDRGVWWGVVLAVAILQGVVILMTWQTNINYILLSGPLFWCIWTILFTIDTI
jgi:hypothetical protein